MEYRLIVFYTVSKHLSFSKASEELFISQPAVTKHIKELESQYQTSFFERSGNKRVRLTQAGEVLLTFVEKIYETSREMNFAINHLSHQYRGKLKIGASSTISQYVLPQFLASFHKKFKDIEVQLTTGNTEEIQKSLLKKKIDLGIIEGNSKALEIHYEDFQKDEIVLVCKTTNNSIQKNSISIKEITQYPILLRENGSGTLEVISNYLEKHQIKLSDLQIEMQLGSTEGIKNYLLESNCLALLSIHSVSRELKENKMKIIEFKEFKMERMFRYISLHGHEDSLVSLFKTFISS